VVLSHSHPNGDGHADIPDDPLGVSTDLLLVPLSCGLTCQASSRPPGFIANIVQLYDSHSRLAIRAGYETTSSGVNTAFIQYSSPDHSPPYTTEIVGPTGVNPDFRGSTDPFATVSISWDGMAWEVSMNGLTDPQLQQEYGEGIDLRAPEFPTTAFYPDQVQLLQEVYGTRDATAPGAVFTNNQVKFLGLGWRTLQEDGTVTIPELTPTHPTLAGWLVERGASTNGGSFYVSCC
jgi:hypothetical protein